ncbi:MAG: polymer-forming cytoskeletal protein [Planctomycetota bacterium]
MAEERSTTQDAQAMTVIGADTTIKGEMFFEKSARILGNFEGKITAKGEVQVGATAVCQAALEAERIIVDGTVQGPITARERLTLTANARVQGDLTAGTLVVAEGASFVGQCNVGPRAKEIAGGESMNRATTIAETKPAGTPTMQGDADAEFRPPWTNDQSTTGASSTGATTAA